jgi:FKBP-type peptidyl-prolyl cis-trans isomerase FkpA
MNTTPSGLQYLDTTVGEGAEAKPPASVSPCTTQAGSGHRRHPGRQVRLQQGPQRDPFVFSLGAGMVIRGWDEGVAGMKVGGARTLIIPPRSWVMVRAAPAGSFRRQRHAEVRRRAARRQVGFPPRAAGQDSADLADQYLRAKAEAENARRRAEEEIAKARKFAVESFADSLLPVRDSLEAGLAISRRQATPRSDPLEGAAGHAAPAHGAPWNATRCWKSTRPLAPSSTRTCTRPSAWCLPNKRPTPSWACCKKATPSPSACCARPWSRLPHPNKPHRDAVKDRRIF